MCLHVLLSSQPSGMSCSRHAVCIFYLVLRALDTVEDDMSIPLDKKVPMLNDFHTYLYRDEWCFTESREKDRQVLEDFPTVSGFKWSPVTKCHNQGTDLSFYTPSMQISLEFRNLAQEYRDVISDICHHMGVGMAEFLEKKVGSMKDWDQVSVGLEFEENNKTATVTRGIGFFLCAVLPLRRRPGWHRPVQALLGVPAGGA